MNLGLVVNWLHIVANVVWIGSICAVSVVLAAKVADAKTRGALARKVYLGLAVPAFGVSVLLGVLRLAIDASHYMKQPWFHLKLTLVVVIIALHHVIGARAKKMEEGDADGPGPAVILAVVLALCAAGAVFAVYLELPSRG